MVKNHLLMQETREIQVQSLGREDSLEKEMVAHYSILLTSLVVQTIKCMPTMQETWVQSLGWEDLLEKGMAAHSSILAWKMPWTKEPGRL